MVNQSMIQQSQLFDAEVSLTSEESTERQILENGIREGLLIAWKNLELIRDKRLYRSSHKTFEGYCGDVWGLSRRHADRQIDAAKVVSNIQNETNLVSNLPTTESQVRPIAPLPPEEQVKVWEKAVEIAPDSKPTARDVEIAKGIVSKPHVTANSGNNEWYTPTIYTDAAREVMGGIDLDPASCLAANRFVKAEKYYALCDDGLKQKWHGRVWLNPPYSQPEIAQFCQAVTEKYHAEEFEQACVLVNNGTETDWGQTLLQSACAVCFINKRIKFWDITGQPANSPLQGQMVVYFGEEIELFLDVFGAFGICLLPAQGQN